MRERQDRPAAKKFFQAVGLLALALVSVYIIVQCFVIFRQSYKTETAIRYTMAESVRLSGVVAFDSVDVAGSGNLGYLVQDGERVTNGTVVAECYTNDEQGVQRERLDRLERTITLLTKSQNSTGSELSVLTNQTRQSLQISTGQTAGFSQTIAALQEEYNSLKSQLDTLQTITAATNGYFSSTAASPSIRADRQALDDADPAALQTMLQEGFPAADADRAGQITTGFSWKFYAVCDLDTAARFENVGTVKISVPGKQNTPLSATVEEVQTDKDGGIAKIVLQCQTINADILGFGLETVQIDLKTYEGIRIDKQALHIVDGQRGVYVKYGNLQRFLRIATLYENDSYILIPDNGKIGTDNEVRLYDEIIVQGTNLQDGKLL